MYSSVFFLLASIARTHSPLSMHMFLFVHKQMHVQPPWTVAVVGSNSNNCGILCFVVLLTIYASSKYIRFPSYGEDGWRGNKNVRMMSEHCIKWSTGLRENSSGKSNSPLEHWSTGHVAATPEAIWLVPSHDPTAIIAPPQVSSGRRRGPRLLQTELHKGRKKCKAKHKQLTPWHTKSG
jgi:hypothetical protein